MAGTFTACTAEEKMYNSSLSPTVSTSVGVSASGGSSEMATTETMQSTEKATVSKETAEYQNHRKSRQWAKFGGCFGNGSDSENTIRGPEQQQEYSE